MRSNKRARPVLPSVHPRCLGRRRDHLRRLLRLPRENHPHCPRFPRSFPGCNTGLISCCWQAEHNVAAYGDGPLPDTIVDAMDAAWDVARVETESYFRGYGEEPGGIELVLAKPQARM